MLPAVGRRGTQLRISTQEQPPDPCWCWLPSAHLRIAWSSLRADSPWHRAVPLPDRISCYALAAFLSQSVYAGPRALEYRKCFGGILGGEPRGAVLGVGWQQRAVTWHILPCALLQWLMPSPGAYFLLALQRRFLFGTQELPAREQSV